MYAFEFNTVLRIDIQFQPLGEEFAEKRHTENAFKGFE